MARVIGLLSGKGGVGKTTITANLGVTLAHDYNKRVIAVDANTTSCCLGFHLGKYIFKTTLNDVLKGRKDISEALYEHPSKLYIIPSSPGIMDLDTNPYYLKENIDLLRPHADIILLDGSPTLGAEAHAVLDACDEVIIITTLETPSILEAARIERLALAKEKKILGVVVNRVNRLNSRLFEKLKKNIKSYIIGTISEDSNVFKSIEQEVPVIHFYPDSVAAANLRRLAVKITGEKFPVEESFFSKMLLLFYGFKNKFI